MPFETQASPPLVCPGFTSLGPPLGLPLGPSLGLYLFLPWALLGLFLLGLILFPVGTWALGSWSLGRGAAKTTQQLKNIIRQLKKTLTAAKKTPMAAILSKRMVLWVFLASGPLLFRLLPSPLAFPSALCCLLN